jgi:hypothetical protein
MRARRTNCSTPVASGTRPQRNMPSPGALERDARGLQRRARRRPHHAPAAAAGAPRGACSGRHQYLGHETLQQRRTGRTESTLRSTSWPMRAVSAAT